MSGHRVRLSPDRRPREMLRLFVSAPCDLPRPLRRPEVRRRGQVGRSLKRARMDGLRDYPSATHEATELLWLIHRGVLTVEDALALVRVTPRQRQMLVTLAGDDAFVRRGVAHALHYRAKVLARLQMALRHHLQVAA